LLLFEKEKLVAPEISLGGNFTYDSNGEYYSTTKVYGYILKHGIIESYYFWLGLMNSNLFWFFLKNTGYVLRGGYYTFKTNYILPFPIPATIPTEIWKNIEHSVLNIIAYKSNNDYHRIKTEEMNINNCIYKLYDIKDKEINIITNS